MADNQEFRALVLAVVKAAGAVADTRRAYRAAGTSLRSLDEECKETLIALDAAVEALRDYAVNEAVRLALQEHPKAESAKEK